MRILDRSVYAVSRPSWARQRRVWHALFLAAIGASLCATDARSQKYSAEDATIHLGAPDTVLDHATRYLQYLSHRALLRNGQPGADALASGHFDQRYLAYQSGMNAFAQASPAAGTPAAPSPRYRAWAETYGSYSRSGVQGTFTGDRRTSLGGIAGVGYVVAPGVNVGASVDQGRTRISVSGVPQSGRVDLTQIGLNGSVDSGPWTFAIAGIHGFGSIQSSRTDTTGVSSASFGTKLWGATGQASYYWSRGAWRVIPMVGLDWARTTIDSFVEIGGGTPVAGSAQDTARSRIFGAVSAGYTGQANNIQYDLGGYVRVNDTVWQSVSSLVAIPTDGITPGRTVPGVTVSRVEFATGASLSISPTRLTRLYLIYDARLRNAFDAHAGTLGFEVRW